MKRLLICGLVLIAVALCTGCLTGNEPLPGEKTIQPDNEASYQTIEEAANFKPYVIRNMLYALKNAGIPDVTKAAYGKNDADEFLEIQVQTGETYRLYLEKTGFVYAIEDLQRNKLIYFIVE